MKLPFDFGPKLVFRLGLPGLVLAFAIAPLIFAFAHAIDVKVDGLEVIALSTVVCGWIISLSDMPIYMLYEGRRFWPKLALEWGIRRETQRLQSLNENATDEVAVQDRNRYEESTIELLNFPLDDAGEPQVIFPTRLGNLITAYESYPKVNFGIDAIFYWPRLWAALDKDLRDEIDNQQAIPDSAIYISFSLWVTAVILMGYAVANGLFHARLAGVPSPVGLLLLACGSAGAAYAVYRLSIFAHAQFGELFRGIFDQHRKKIVIDDIVEKVGSLTHDACALKRPEPERYLMVSRYLRWHRIRPPSENKNYTPEAWKAELKRGGERDENARGDGRPVSCQSPRGS
jgi:hypothetical protein